MVKQFKKNPLYYQALQAWWHYSLRVRPDMYHPEAPILHMTFPIVFKWENVLIFIQYFARNWPWYSLRGLHIRITWFSLYGIRIPLFSLCYPYALISLYGNNAQCSGCGAAMDSIVPRTAIVTSQWYDHYCFAGYARTWARHPTTPWQRECTAITDFQSIDSL